MFSFFSLFIFLIVPQVSEAKAPKLLFSCQCRQCGSYDFIRDTTRLRVDYDHCARGGRGSHQVAWYEPAPWGWERTRHLGKTAPRQLSTHFDCEEYCGGACQLPRNWSELLQTEVGRRDLFERARRQCGTSPRVFQRGKVPSVRFFFSFPKRDVANPAYNGRRREFYTCFALPPQVHCEPF